MSASGQEKGRGVASGGEGEEGVGGGHSDGYRMHGVSAVQEAGDADEGELRNLSGHGA